MTPKETAIYLVRRFIDLDSCKEHYEDNFNRGICKHLAKECALIVSEMCYKEAYKQGNEIADIRQEFWLNVASEIHSL